MQILYVTTMVTIFVLCLMLLSIARRILRASPLQSGELGLSRIYGTSSLNQGDDSVKEREDNSSPRMTVHPEKAVRDKDNFDAIENLRLALVSARVPQTEPELVAPESNEIAAAAVQESKDQPAPARLRRAPVRKIASVRKASNYNYLLEAFLIGISVVVLVQTQRSASRYRSLPPSSRKDVA